jgi:DNA-nicking Smr family endonuclease
MSRRPLSDGEEKLWQAVIKDIPKLHHNIAPPEEVFKKAHFKIKNPSKNYDFKDFNFGLSPEDFQNQPLVQNTGGVQNTTGIQNKVADLKNKDHNWLKKIRSKKSRPEGKIDLHGMTQDQAYRVLHHYIDGALARNKRLILVVTGKGGIKNNHSDFGFSDYESNRGILRTQVPRWLAFGDLSHKIVSYYSANPDEGGEGAIYVVLKK